MSRAVKALFKIIISLLLAAVLVVAGVNAWVFLMSNTRIDTLQEAEQSAQVSTCDAIVVLGASVLPDGSLSDILESRVDAAIELYNSGVSSVIIMSGDGRAKNYDEPRAMKNYAMSKGVPESAIYCDGGGYHTYDTMWRVANVYGARCVCVVTQQYHLYRAVYDAQSVGLVAHGVVSDSGVYEDQLYYDLREWPARVQDFVSVVTKASPDNPTEEITL